MIQFLSSAPWYLWVIPIVIALVFSFLLYRKNEFAHEIKTSSWVYRSMIALRFISAFTISFLLLGLIIKTSEKIVKKPVLLFVMDNSISMVQNKDSVFVKNTFIKEWEQLQNELKDDYKIVAWNVADKVEATGSGNNFDGNSTNLSLVFDEAKNQYVNDNLGAIILASDGIYNTGISPEYVAVDLNTPVFTVGLGDTTVYRDVAITNVKYNRINYLNNSFQTVVEIKANKFSGNAAQIQVYRDNQLLESRKIDFVQNNEYKSLVFEMEADKVGVQKYTYVITGTSGEKTLKNNTFHTYIETLDNRDKILLLAAVPHPDISAMVSAIQSKENYEITTYLAPDFPAINTLNKYSAIIYHGFPSQKQDMRPWMDKAQELKISQLFCITSTTFKEKISDKTGVNIKGGNRGSNEALAVINEGFNLYNISEENKKRLGKFPPLDCIYGSYETIIPSSQQMLFQKIGSVNTQLPLVTFNISDAQKNATIFGEGLYRWRIFDHMKNGNGDAFNEFVTSIIQYLSAKKDTRKFRVSPAKNIFTENERISFQAEVYNESNQVQKNASISLSLTDSSKKTTSYQFMPNGNFYELNIGNLPSGNYVYAAQALYGDKKMSLSGRFSVQSSSVEYTNTVANHQVLFNTAKKTNGKFIYPDGLMKLAKDIEANKNIISTSYLQSSFTELINQKWIFWFILLVLVSEWALRRYFGNY